MNLEQLDPLQEYMYTIRSKETKRIYKVYIKYFEDFAKMSLTDLLELDVADIQEGNDLQPIIERKNQSRK